MCKSEIVAKFGSHTVAEQIISAKTSDAEVAKSHVRPNPDLHGLDTEDPRKSLYGSIYLISYGGWWSRIVFGGDPL